MVRNVGCRPQCQTRSLACTCPPIRRGLGFGDARPRQGRSYTLTLNGEPLARIIPIRRRRAVPKEEVLAIFATAPAIDADELRAELDDFMDQEIRDPFEGTGL